MRRTVPALAVALLLSVAACGGEASPTAAPPASQPPSDAPPSAAAQACLPSSAAGAVAASILDFEFDPTTVEASVGDVVTWTNDGAAPHTATLDDDPACTTPQLAGGESGGIQFNEAGTFTFVCTVHPTMTGTVEVSG